jgi:hypothetical protein
MGHDEPPIDDYECVFSRSVKSQRVKSFKIFIVTCPSLMHFWHRKFMRELISEHLFKIFMDRRSLILLGIERVEPIVKMLS